MGWDVQDIKRQCDGRWAEIIASVCSVNPSVLDGGHHPCPKCGGTKRFNLDREGSGAAYCNDCPDGPCVGSDGIGTIQWLKGCSFNDAMKLLEPFVSLGSKVPEASPSTADLRNKVYSRLANIFPLSDKHRKELSDRGLSDPEIADRGYWTAPQSAVIGLLKSFQRKHIKLISDAVPGVFPGGSLSLSVRNVLMIPVRDSAGRVIAAQCRPSKPLKSGLKYFWFSSKDHISPGSPCHVATPFSELNSEVVRITEGPLKADIAASLSSITTLGIAGVNNWRVAAEEIERLKPPSVWLAFDNDSMSNPGVARAVVEIFDHLNEKGFVVKLETWDSAFKGIDDALAAGMVSSPLSLESTKRKINSMRSVAAGSNQSTRLRNYKIVPSTGDNPNVAWEHEPLPVPEMSKHLLDIHDGWPKSSRGQLFVPDKKGGIRFFRSSHELYGWIGSREPVEFSGKCGGVGKMEFFAELPNHVEQFEATEEYPHFPKIDGHYYCQEIKPGDGQYLEKFLDFFSPATDYDRQLILALIATTFWGGSPGRRVAFGIDSVVGTGAGKSELAKRVASLSGGCYDIDAKDISESELRRKLVNGDKHRIALMDNVRESCLSNATIESILTSPTLGGHQLHVGYTSRPNTLTWVFTMNGMSLSRDLAQRTVVIKLREPKRSGTWDDEVDAFVRDHRADVIADVAGFFAKPRATLDRFTRWASWEQAVLSRLEGPAALQQIIQDRSGESDEDHKTALSIKEFFSSQLADLGYSNGSEPVHIPNEIATEWLIESTGKEFSKRSARSAIKNLVDGGSLKNFGENPSRKNGRGWLWNFQNKTAEVNYTLKETFLAKKRRDEFFKNGNKEKF